MNHDEVFVLPHLTHAQVDDLVRGLWMRRGACTWTPEIDVETADDDDMKLVCAQCPVRAECLAYGLLIDARHYVYGGLTPDERRAHDNGQRYAVCSGPNCGRGYVWLRVGNAKPPGVCETCNSTERLSTHYHYGDRHA